jgi:hypothetical protein
MMFVAGASRQSRSSVEPIVDVLVHTAPPAGPLGEELIAIMIDFALAPVAMTLRSGVVVQEDRR